MGFVRDRHGTKMPTVKENPKRCYECTEVLSGNLKLKRVKRETHVTVELVHEGCAKDE